MVNLSSTISDVGDEGKAKSPSIGRTRKMSRSLTQDNLDEVLNKGFGEDNDSDHDDW